MSIISSKVSRIELLTCRRMFCSCWKSEDVEEVDVSSEAVEDAQVTETPAHASCVQIGRVSFGLGLTYS